MPYRAAWLVACIAVAPIADAQDIHKCRTATGAVAYQSDPCPNGQVEIAMLSTTGRANAARAEEPPVNEELRFPTARWLPFRRAQIVRGMTDDEVLNTPRWGPPTRISRTRENGIWRESWVYARVDGTRKLSFVNGKLTSIETDADPPARIAGLR